MTLTCHRGEPYEYQETETGLKLFSVSQVRKIMHDSMAHVPADRLDAARARGALLHQRFWRLLASRSGLCAVPPIIEAHPGQCRAMDEWAERRQIRAIKLEEPSLNRKLGIAGCVDTQCLYGEKNILTLADLKSGQPQETDPAQLLAYNELEGYRCDQLLDLYVHDDGTYDEVFVSKKDRTTQWTWFLSALGVLRSRRNHGITD